MLGRPRPLDAPGERVGDEAVTTRDIVRCSDSPSEPNWEASIQGGKRSSVSLRPYRYAMAACQLAWAGCTVTGHPTELLLHERDSLFQHFMLVAGKVEGLLARTCCFSNPAGCVHGHTASLAPPAPSPPVQICDVTTQEDSIGGSLLAGPAEGVPATSQGGSGLVVKLSTTAMAPLSQQSKRQEKKRRAPDVATAPEGTVAGTIAVVEPGMFVSGPAFITCYCFEICACLIECLRS